MTKIRTMVNGLSLAVITAGVFALNPRGAEAVPVPADGGTCCDQSGATCYLSVGGLVISQPNAYYSSGPCAATPKEVTAE